MLSSLQPPFRTTVNNEHFQCRLSYNRELIINWYAANYNLKCFKFQNIYFTFWWLKMFEIWEMMFSQHWKTCNNLHLSTVEATSIYFQGYSQSWSNFLQKLKCIQSGPRVFATRYWKYWGISIVHSLVNLKQNL